jgi:hypothetical protein
VKEGMKPDKAVKTLEIIKILRKTIPLALLALAVGGAEVLSDTEPYNDDRPKDFDAW